MSQQPISRPDCVTTDMLEYLDLLRETGKLNMFGARGQLMYEFETLTRDEAGEVLTYWRKTYNPEGR